MPPVLPRVVVNFKTYGETTGRRAVALSRAARTLEKRTGVEIAVVPQAVDIRACVAARATVFAQHFDRVESSQSTGATRWESLVDAGVAGSLVNHSEKRLPGELIAWNVEQVRRSRLASLVCTKDAAESAVLAALKPDLLAVEPPELIGGDVSVTSADPDIVRSSVRAVRSVQRRLPVLCGAGVKDDRDVAEAIRLGARGILVASGVTKAARPAKALERLLRGFQSDAAGGKRVKS